MDFHLQVSLNAKAEYTGIETKKPNSPSDSGLDRFDRLNG
jgi:hypothetical protein